MQEPAQQEKHGCRFGAVWHNYRVHYTLPAGALAAVATRFHVQQGTQQIGLRMTDSLFKMGMFVLKFWWTITQIDLCFVSSSLLGVLASCFWCRTRLRVHGSLDPGTSQVLAWQRSWPGGACGHVQWLLAYLAASMLVGLALTYYYDNPDNAKLNTILQRGLQIVGLALVAWGPALPECGALAAGVLVAWHLAGGLHRLPRHAFVSSATVPALWF